MKLLIDQNLSPVLARIFSDRFPGSTHTELIGLGEADDPTVWEFARSHGFVIVTKDADFPERSLLMGHPPKVVWLRLGNCGTRRVVALIRARMADLDVFLQSPEESVIRLP